MGKRIKALLISMAVFAGGNGEFGVMREKDLQRDVQERNGNGGGSGDGQGGGEYTRHTRNARRECGLSVGTKARSLQLRLILKKK